jgi:hypothetical protein
MWLLWMAFRSADATECRAADAILALICPRLGMCLALPAPRESPPLLHGTADVVAPAAAWLVIFGGEGSTALLKLNLCDDLGSLAWCVPVACGSTLTRPAYIAVYVVSLQTVLVAHT